MPTSSHEDALILATFPCWMADTGHINAIAIAYEQTAITDGVRHTLYIAKIFRSDQDATAELATNRNAAIRRAMRMVGYYH